VTPQREGQAGPRSIEGYYEGRDPKTP